MTEDSAPNCPARATHLSEECAVCGWAPAPAMHDTILSATVSRPEPGNFWWDTQVSITLNGREQERRAWIRMREDPDVPPGVLGRYWELEARHKVNAVERLAHLVGMAERNAT